MNTSKKSRSRKILPIAAIASLAALAALALVFLQPRATREAPAPRADEAVSDFGSARVSRDTGQITPSHMTPRTLPADTRDAGSRSITPARATHAPPADARDAGRAASAFGARAHAAATPRENIADSDTSPDSSLPRWQRDILDKIPGARFRDDVLALEPEARASAFKALAAARVPDADYDCLHVTQKGMLYYACALSHTDDAASAATTSAQTSAGESATKNTHAPSVASALPGAIMQPDGSDHSSNHSDHSVHSVYSDHSDHSTFDIQHSSSGDATVAAAPVPIDQPPKRHSRPGSRNVLFLDFGGMDIAGTAWNELAILGKIPIYRAKPYDTDGNPATFSDQEQRAIIEIWERVAEDFSPFDIDVTTEKPATFTRTTGRALITRSVDSNNVTMPYGDTSSGVAFLNFFGEINYDFASPALIYYDTISSIANIACVVSHELGHNLGLSHQGPGSETSEEDFGYYPGHGSGVMSWAPIMGTGYNRRIVQWSKGDYFNANNHEDAIAIIEGKVGYRHEAATTTLDSAAAGDTFILGDNGRLGATGIIRHAKIGHYFCFDLTTSASVSIALTPCFLSYSGSIVGDTNLGLELYNYSSGTLVAADPPSTTTTSAAISRQLDPGRYFLRASSGGVGTPFLYPPSGYTSYGSIGQYTLTTNLIDSNPTLAAALNSNLAWTTQANPAGAAGWFAQTTTTHDDISAAQSGPIDQDQSTALLATVEGPGAISWWWKITADASDCLTFAITEAGGVPAAPASISGVHDWEQCTHTITASGTHHLAWVFDKAFVSGDPPPSFSGSAWLDQVTWTPDGPAFTITPAASDASPETGQLNIFVETNKAWTATTDADSASWLAVTPAAGTGNATLTVAHTDNDTPGPRRGTVTITSAGINRTCEVVQPPLIPLATALGIDLAWRTGGDSVHGGSKWFGQEITTRADHSYAARSGIILGTSNTMTQTGQKTWLEGTVEGPGTISFWWKVSSEEEVTDKTGTWGDVLRFQMDGVEKARISGEQDWARRLSTTVGAGTHTLRWTYDKDPLYAGGADAAWLDDVIWMPGVLPTLNLSPDTMQVPVGYGQFTLALDADLAWNATSNVSWLAITPATGDNSATLNVSHFANNTPVARTGVITVTSADIVVTCTVTQAPYITLSLSPVSRQVSAASGQFQLSVGANTTWNATSSVPWMTVSPSSGNGAGTLTVSHVANTATTSRTGSIMLTSGSGVSGASCAVTQAGAAAGGNSGGNNTGGNTSGGNSGGGGGGGAPSLLGLLALALLFALRPLKGRV